jgi:hypothetical protein
MKKILIATTNPGKIAATKKILERLGYEGVSFADLDLHLDEPDETMPTAEEIATEKALGYAKQYGNLPVLARDDVMTLIGVDEEDEPKNHGKAFVAKRAGEYTDEKGSQVFADIAHKYGGEVWLRFDWGYGLAWRQTNADGKEETKVVHGLATTGDHLVKIVDKISPIKVPGFCFSPIIQVEVDGKWKYDSEFTDEDNWKTYWHIQAETIKSLLDQLG